MTNELQRQKAVEALERKKAKEHKQFLAMVFHIFTMAKMTMDTYQVKFEGAKKRREERFRNLNTNYKPGSPLFVEERDSIAPQFQKEVEKARHDLIMEFEDSLMKLRAIETAKVAVISSETKTMMSVLDCLETKTVSVDEYKVLVQHYGGKSYWIDRFLETLADKCGIMDSMYSRGCL